LVGITAMSAQLLIPLAVDLTRPERRGHTVGTLMAGLLVGILLARTLSGFVGDQLGWRAMYALAAAAMLAMAVILQATLPHRAPSLRLTYPALMRSLLHLLRTQPQLWVASIVSALSFASFTAFWTVLSFLMKQHFHRGATEAGLFGVIGVVGAMAAPLAGKLSDRRGPAFTVTLALLSTMAAFAVMWIWVTIPALIVGVLLMDLGVQSVQVAAQSEVMALVPDARSRVNTLYMVARFIGGAAGSAAGAIAWSVRGWSGACAVAISLLVAGTLIHVLGTRRPRLEH
ncbi:MAG: MFS transporter, partial [Tepidisphaeraceae bacterium]